MLEASEIALRALAFGALPPFLAARARLGTDAGEHEAFLDEARRASGSRRGRGIVALVRFEPPPPPRCMAR